MAIYSNSTHVATEPFPSQPPTIRAASGLQSYVPYGLVPLKVLFTSRNGKYSAGDIVYVRSDLSQVYKVQQLGDIKFVLVEENRVDLFEPKKSELPVVTDK